jgi:adenosylmethionine-8-amino-7-oxononanoate aminotransferase
LGHLNVMSPALTITEGQVDFVVDTLRKAIAKVTDDLVREGYRIG